MNDLDPQFSRKCLMLEPRIPLWMSKMFHNNLFALLVGLMRIYIMNCVFLLK